MRRKGKMLMAGNREATVAIIDYEAGNLFSVQHACETVGLDCRITKKPNEVKNADALILPGVGAFGDAMNNLKMLGLIQPLKDFAASGKPFLGVCLGMQLLFSESEEFGNVKGLNILEGRVTRFPEVNENGKRVKIPHIGWNRIYNPPEREGWSNTALEHIVNGEFMYFIHSFYVCPYNKDQILSLTDYEGIEYCSAVKKDNIFATQFHPEKSAEEGMKIYLHWATFVKEKKENGFIC
jgi:imidazole glycerol-phosphate synthase subunit HisH